MAREEILQEIMIEPDAPALHYWRDLWRYRELLMFLVWRDVLVRYKQTAVGVLWTVLRPLLAMAAFTLVFGVLAKMPSRDVPYPLLVFTGLLPWTFFANALSESSASLVGNANLLTKVYFPRLIVPLGSILASLVDLVISLAMLGGGMLWYGFMPDWRLAALPLFLILCCLTLCGAGLWFAALNVKYRDFRYLIPFLLQFGLYVSPVGFSSAVVPGAWRFWYSLNPMVGVIDGFRWTLLGGRAEVYWPGVAISAILSLILLFSGLWFFRRTERILADVI